MSVATGRPVIGEVMTAVSYSLRLALLATIIGLCSAACSALSPAIFATALSIAWHRCCRCFGVSVPHYWLGMLLVIAFSVKLAVLPATGGGPIGENRLAVDWQHLQFMCCRR
ncbi:Nickel transport system permease protein nikB [Raoultella terrigena]|uniref:Nickel transport system permease protein nikB n=1 Tax=Raoultella terrigena TaxID=577 RepID=A0A4U9DB19_RAOTE|nr:Nickel transport system permease protein nikB [Raoultella terrigena]